MTDKPILFSAPMVRALLAGRKTQTRRIINRISGRFGKVTEFDCSTTPGYDFHFRDKDMRWHDFRRSDIAQRLPYQIGDRLWVRETHVIENTREYDDIAIMPVDNRPFRTIDDGEWGRCRLIPHYRATDPEPHIVDDRANGEDDRTRWRPSIFMQRWASRLTLTVTGVRVQRLHDISEGDCFAEGIEQHGRFYGLADDDWDRAALTPRAAYYRIWNAINGERAAAANPWVAATTFIVEQRNIDAGSTP